MPSATLAQAAVLTVDQEAVIARWEAEGRAVEVLGWSSPTAVGMQLLCNVSGRIRGVLSDALKNPRYGVVHYRFEPASVVPLSTPPQEPTGC